jgi:hypothetical protein
VSGLIRNQSSLLLIKPSQARGLCWNMKLDDFDDVKCKDGFALKGNFEK